MKLPQLRLELPRRLPRLPAGTYAILLASLLSRTTRLLRPPSAAARVEEGGAHLLAAEADGVRALRSRLHLAVEAAGYDKSAELWGVPLAEGDAHAAQQEALLRAFLKARSGNVAAAQKLVTNALRWRKEYGTDAIGSSDDFGGWPSDLLAGSDGDGRPLVLVRLGALPESAFADVDRFVRWRVAELEKAIRQLGLDQAPAAGGESPAFTLVIDADGLKAHHFSKAARACVGEFSRVSTHYYPEFKAQTLIVNAAPLFRVAWFAVKPFISKAFVATTQLCSLDEAGCTITEDLPGAPLRRKAAAPRPAIVLQALRRLLTIVRALLANFFTKMLGPTALGHAKAGSFAEVEYAV